MSQDWESPMEPSAPLQNGAQRDDADLLTRIAGGDQTALRQLLLQHGQAIYAYALRRLGSADDAQEVVNDTLLAVWRQAQRSRPMQIPSLRAWLLGIARHKIVDLLRSRGQHWRETADEDDRLLATAADPDPSPLDRLCQDCDDTQLAHALAALPPVQREALYLFTYEGLSLAEIAAIQQVPLATVGTRLHLARQRLRRSLMADGVVS
jgi:RNA polymerase sigma-70 factor (ECF subfamily)